MEEQPVTDTAVMAAARVKAAPERQKKGRLI
jgi:hypothetical protein